MPGDAAKPYFSRAAFVAPNARPADLVSIEPELLEWYKAQGSGWLTRINDVLREHRDAVTAAG